MSRPPSSGSIVASQLSAVTLMAAVIAKSVPHQQREPSRRPSGPLLAGHIVDQRESTQWNLAQHGQLLQKIESRRVLCCCNRNAKVIAANGETGLFLSDCVTTNASFRGGVQLSFRGNLFISAEAHGASRAIKDGGRRPIWSECDQSDAVACSPKPLLRPRQCFKDGLQSAHGVRGNGTYLEWMIAR